MYRRHGDSQLLAHFLRRQQTAFAQPTEATFQMIRAANPSHFLQCVGLILPGAASLLVEDFCDLTVTVIVEQTVDLSDDLWFGLANVGDRHGCLHRQGAQRTPTKSNVNRELTPC